MRRRKLARLFVGLIFAAGLGAACEAVYLPANGEKKHAEVVFRGTISEYRDSGTGYKIAVYRVSRVWKGRVGQTMELSTFPGYSDAPCASFSTKLFDIGSDVIVFARKEKGKDFLTGYWWALSAQHYPYLSQLGPGKQPPTSR